MSSPQSVSAAFTPDRQAAPMRIANLDGRLVLLFPDAAAPAGRAVDVETASEGRFHADPQRIYQRWVEFRDWAARLDTSAGESYDAARLGPPVPRPPQVFAIGLNYSEHAAESGFAAPQGAPPVFPKSPACITGPHGVVELPPGGHTDWEVELVVV